MSKANKRLEAMRGNAAGDWRIADVELVCRAFGVDCTPPSGGGSHYTVSHPDMAAILTVPARRPIKPVYIRKLVSYIDEVRSGEDEQG
jgi:hypothetical protein